MIHGCRVAVLLLGFAVATPAQSVVLNEVQVSNQTTITDENADTPDWIELFNPGPASVDLNSWGLSDSTNALFRWTFTNASLAPGSFLLVFASGKDRQPGQFGAVNPVSVPGLRIWLRAEAVNTADATQVRASAGSFHVRSWRDQSGAAFHAGQGTDANQPRFIPAAPELGGRPALRFDGTNDVLYLPASPAANNFTIIAVARPTAGHEIDPQGAAGVGGVSGQRYLFGAQHGGDFNGGSGLSLGTNGASIYEHGSGYMPALAVLATPIASLAIVSVHYSNKQPTLTVNGTLSSPGAISPRATVTAPVELGAGAYGAFAGDVAEILIFDRTLTEAEARGIEESLRVQYGLTFPAAIRHTNFSLDKDGEKVFLTRPDGTLADWLPSVEIPRDLSWGRQPDGSTNFFFFATPTPGANNSTPGATDFLKMPKFSVVPGFYTTNVTLELINTNLLPGAVIRYTRDGSEPTTNSALYTTPIVLGPRLGTPNDISMIPTAGGWQPPLGEVFKLHVIRTRAFRTNSIPSGVNTATYCVDPRGRGRFSLPVVSLSSDRRNFFDPNTGIHVCGNTPGCNYAQSGDLWERPCHVEFFETNGLRVLDQKSGVRMHVAWLHRFATNRATYARQQLTNQFGLRGLVTVTLGVNDTNAGTVRLNTLTLAPPTNAPWSGTYFRDNAVTFSAQPYNGYRFRNWTGLAGPPATNATNTLTLNGNLALTANFEALPATNSPLPLAHDLATGPYVLTVWSSDAPAGRYPPHMLFLQTPTNAAPDPALAVEFTNWWTLPYDRASRSRINALGDDGIAFLNTSDPQADGGGYLGAAVLALNTTGRTNVQVAWRAGTVTPNSRPYAIRLQYRVGVSNAFADVLDATGQPVEYLRSGVAGHSAALGPATLPPEGDDQPYVQLRWKYYSLGGTSGSRDQLRLDDIIVADRITLPGPGSIAVQPDGRFLIRFAGLANFPYTMESSTNLVDWVVAGPAASGGTGMIEFTAAASTNGPTRFFRVHWP
jgi:hypothetical protein